MGDYLDKLARCVKHFLGRREEGAQHNIPLWRTCLWSFVGAFIGLSLLEILFSYTQTFQDLNVPMIAASCGATAVLIYGAIEAPLAQPRAMIGGNLIASFVGVCIHKLFLEINTPDQYVTHVRWIGGATSVSLTIVLMQLTKTTHPPSGATSLLPMATPEIGSLGWLYIGIIMLSSAILLVVALVVDNIERRYPTYWWSVALPKSKRTDIEMSLGSNDSSKETVAEEQPLVIFGQAVPQDMLNSDEEEFLRKLAGRFQKP